MGIRSSLRKIMEKVVNVIIPEPEPQRPLAHIEQVKQEIDKREESRLSAKEKAVEKATDKARTKAKETGYTEQQFDKMVEGKAVIVGVSPAWLVEFLDELVKINCHFIESPSAELNADFRRAGAISVLRPHKRDWGLRDWWR